MRRRGRQNYYSTASHSISRRDSGSGHLGKIGRTSITFALTTRHPGGGYNFRKKHSYFLQALRIALRQRPHSLRRIADGCSTRARRATFNPFANRGPTGR
jgi:hypothetical protein